MSYAWYKFHKAIRSLAIARAHKKNWLASDYVSRIILLNPDDLPAAIQPEFRRFRHDMTLKPAESVVASLRVTVNAMSEGEVIKMILRIIKMHDALKAHEDAFEAPFSLHASLQDQAA